MALSPLTQNMLMGPSESRQGPKKNPIDTFLNTPGGSFLMNILAQSGYSPVPQSEFGAIGRAALATQQQGRQRRLDNLQEGLIQSRIGLNQRAPVANRNVQSQFITDEGKLGFLRRDGEVVVTDTDVRDTFSIQTLPDGSQIGVDKSNPSNTVPVVTPSEAAAATTRQAQTKAQQTLPAELAGLDSTINTADATIEKIREVLPLVKPSTVGIESATRGNLPGFLGGEARTLKQQVKSLQANFGFDTLQKMRAASKTGGALGQVSERELDLLINALRSIDLEGDVDVLRDNLNSVITHYENYKREIEAMKVALQQQAGVTPDTQKPISEMTDAELQAIIDGSNP